MYRQRGIVQVVIFSILCGIYFFYWIYITTVDINSYLEINSEMDPGIELLLCIVCFPYIYYWFYKYGERMKDVQTKAGLPVKNESVLYLVLSILGLSIVGQAIMQDNLNQAWAIEQNRNL